MFKRLFDPTSIFEKAAKKSNNFTSIGRGFYNRLAKKLKDDYWCSNCSNLIDSYDSFGGINIFHIKNEQLAHLMYLAVKQNAYDATNFNNIKFITIGKQEQVVFAVCDKDNGEDKILKLMDIADSFGKLFSTEESKVYIDYSLLFSVYNYYRTPNIMEILFRSISLDPVTVTSEDITKVINEVLHHYKNDYYLYDLIDGIKSEESDFFIWLKKGVLIDRVRYVNYLMPMALFVNILKYALDNNAFSSLRELFTLDERFNSFDNAKEVIVIDEELFANSLKRKDENDEFVIFEDDAQNIFAQFKYPNSNSKLTDVVFDLIREDLVVNSKIVRSCGGNVYLFINGSFKYTTLREHIHSIASNDDNFISLVTKLHSFFSTQASYNTLKFQANTDFLNCMCYTEGNANIPFIQLSNIATVTEGQPFDYRLVIMMVIREYVSCSQIAMNEIHLREFSKVFHPLFVVAAKKYIESGSYTRDESIENRVISGCLPSQVEFLEKLPTGDAHILSRLSFFDGVNLPENLLTSLNKQREIDKSKGYLILDEYLNFFTLRSISKGYIDRIFSDLGSDLKERFLIPEKIIISSESNSNDNYQIVGVLWNHSSLRNAVDVIKSKELNCKEVYLFISNLFSAYVQNGLSVDIPNANEYLLMDMSNMEFVLTRKALNYKVFYPLSHRQAEDYYDQIISFLNNTADLETNYDIFEYAELLRKYDSSVDLIHNVFRHNVDGMMLCKEHNHWHLANGLCCDCKRVYEITKCTSVKGPFYEDEVSKFFSLSGYNTLYKSSEISPSQVKIGLEHDLYSKFFGLVPKKLLMNGSNRSIFGIKYTRCAGAFFDNIVDLNAFKHAQRLKAILLIYQKLVPFILDGSFICTDERIFSTIVMHKDHKGEILIPNLPLMECDAIVSNDSSFRRRKIAKTKTVFANFLLKYIMEDEYLATMVNSKTPEFVDIVEDIKNLTFSDLVIKYCLNLNKNYCKTHMAPFSTKHKLCPMCKKDGIIESKAVFETQDFFDFDDEDSDYDGGEANIYVLPLDTTDALKVFKNTVDLSFKSKILAKALEKSKLIDGFNMEHKDIQIISVKKIYYMFEDGVLQLKGFTQAFIEGSFKISSLKDKDFVKAHGYSRKDIVEILIKVCKGITFLHSIGGFIGDLNGGNILIKGKSVYIIDIDGMSFDDVRNCVYTNLYIYPPSAENNNITKEDDWYSLAVQAFYYLTYSHPFRGICDSDKVPENEAERMTQGLSVLGNHGIVPPSISIGWDFLPKPLLQYFLDTFEGKRRESMLEILQAYHGTLKQTYVGFTEIKRDRSVSLNISEHVYIDADDVLVFNETELEYASDCEFFTYDNNNVLIGLEDRSYFLDTMTRAFYTIPKTYNCDCPISLLDENIYYTSDDQRTLFVDTISDGGSAISTHAVKKTTADQILYLLVAEKDKFVFVEDNADADSYDVYCNSIKVHSVDKNTFAGIVDIDIAYDELSKNWLVMFKSQNLAIGVVIERDSGRVSQFEICKSLSASICFYGNVLYYVDNGKIYYYNVIKNTLKNMECEYATSDSRIHRYGNKFVVVNTTKAYLYEKP